MPIRQWTGRARLAGALAVLAVLAVVVGTARSTTTQVVTANVAAVPPMIENEVGHAPDEPDQYQDFKDSSARDVSAAQLERAAAQAAAIPSDTSTGPWKLVGPNNVGGRIVDMVVDNQAPDTVYAAASGGGIWKSTDQGMTYKPVWPTTAEQTMGALAQGSDGTLWAGTGEANPSGGGLTFYGDGIYKSTDGGASWTNVGLPDSASFGRIVVDPANPNVVYAAASGSISRIVSERGLYKTTDGGKTWERILAPPNATTGAIDIAIDPANSQRVFASLWDKKRNNGARVYGGIGSGLFRSDDGGATWKRLENITSPTPATDTSGTGLKADASLGRIGIAIAPSDHNRVYVVSGNPYGPDKGSYISNDGGDSFQTMGRAYAANGYQWWFGRLFVDPVDKNHVFNADVNLRESNDGGATWHTSSGPHSDHHSVVWDPRVPNRVYNGDDGGIYRSDKNGATGTWIHGTDMPFNQSYHIAVDPKNPDRVVTGLQDNGSVRNWTAAAPAPADPSQFNSYGGGDGHWVLIDPNDSNTYYSCSQNAGCQGNNDLNGTTTKWSFGRHAAGMRFTTDAQIAFDPSNTKTIYVGGSALERSTDQGRTWTSISPLDDASSLPGPVPPDEVDLGGTYSNAYATISAIGVAKTDGNVIYAGTDTGRLWKTTNLGQTWTRMTGVPDRWVNAVVVDPTDANHAYAAFAGFREGDESANVYETTNGGTSWVNVSLNLPNAPVQMIEYDQVGKVLYAATDYGVFEHKDGDGYWYGLNGGLPNTPVLDVKLSGDHKWLYAGTFGRSIMRLPLSTSVTTGSGSGGGNGGGPGGTVGATLSLSLGANASFGAFTPGLAKTYAAATTANVISTAGDATLTVADPSATAPGRLVNGAFSLVQPVQAKANTATNPGSAFAPVGTSPLTLLTWNAPVSNDSVTVSFQQSIGANDPLRTGTYGKTLTFTLSTTTP